MFWTGEECNSRNTVLTVKHTDEGHLILVKNDLQFVVVKTKV